MESSHLEDIIVNLLRLAATELPVDVILQIKRALKNEINQIAREQLKAILKNIGIAKEENLPICQDTGIQTFFISVGTKFPLIEELTDIIIRAVRRGTTEIPLRPNAVNPITKENTGDNVGSFIPWINWKIVKGSDLEITVFPKGGGSENVSNVAMLNPAQGLTGVKKFVLDTIIKAGGKPCPPIIIGIGIGGGVDICLKLAKEQLLRPVGQKHTNEIIASIEEDLEYAINDLGIGPMGLGGETTTLGVHIEVAMRHPASFPVGVVIQCWAARRASAIITKEGNVKYTTHEV
ncbi:MAG: fumarate hydratase [Promethearchaeota archaeon]